MKFRPHKGNLDGTNVPMYDKRINWHTYIVTLDGYGVFGFTDGPA